MIGLNGIEYWNSHIMITYRLIPRTAGSYFGQDGSRGQLPSLKMASTKLVPEDAVMGLG